MVLYVGSDETPARTAPAPRPSYRPWADGVFITVDGPSGVGKTTMTGLLAKSLRGYGLTVTSTTEPSPSAMGELARYGTHQYHGRSLSCLIAADRYYHAETVIRPALERGEVVVCDRYLPSSLVLDQLDGVPFDFVWNTQRDLPWPHLAVFLTGSWQLCAQRAAGRGNHSRFQLADRAAKQREAELFGHVADELVTRGYPVWPYDIGDQSPEAVHNALVLRATDQFGW
ncbi:dTMP kinase [Actinacidiphila sp. ITFR-21]|uniref:dTMP kinase n=1 Tax=Actinacidiphila sp. ITFR-21 TaxID=3075199 RepID=UPI002889AF4D|nr:dTMP kinase [Streptomyces sp. ITFR-21]WNI15460.1 dTMP kinase [Streptomyces sp. ITFR-21]